MAGMQGAGLVVPFSPCFRGKKKCLHPHLNTLLKIFSFALKAGGRLVNVFPLFPFLMHILNLSYMTQNIIFCGQTAERGLFPPPPRAGVASSPPKPAVLPALPHPTLPADVFPAGRLWVQPRELLPAPPGLPFFWVTFASQPASAQGKGAGRSAAVRQRCSLGG